MFKVNEKESITVMSLEDFCAIPDNPRQRDTERHAKKAVKDHLKEAAEIHKYVEVAVLPNGEMIKLDGHTRAYLWQLGKLATPPFVVAKLRAAKDIKDVMKMYMEYDAQGAVESNSDRVAGALRQTNTQFESALLKSGKFISALSLAKHGFVDSKFAAGEGMYDLIEEFRDELLKLDGINPVGDRFVSGVLAAALITVRKYGDAALEFWVRYNCDMGEKIGKEKCAVQALSDLLQMRRAAGTLSARVHVVDMCGRAMAACDKWMKGEAYSGGIKGVDVMTYVKSIKKRSPLAVAQEQLFAKRVENVNQLDRIAKFPVNPFSKRG